jgi:predicted nucleic acid-binding Zn finger protein
MTEQRIERALNQKLCLINQEKRNDEIEYSIMGTTGNIYSIIINKRDIWKCSCPDYLNRKRDCKHILFLQMKVLNSSKWNEISKYNLSDLWIEKDLKQKYETKKRKLCTKEEEINKKDLRKNDNCGICFELINEEDNIFGCPFCKNILHQFCWNQWLKVNNSCVFCRKKQKISSKEDNNDSYINLLND